ncbi:hypothetical protein [Streptomyces sp. NPDC002962]|uniref:hypothetical protein n=1 Tax=Streptomyces sp. NPDC002962 TaxID=3364674 RepID=UPI003690AF09
MSAEERAALWDLWRTALKNSSIPSAQTQHFMTVAAELKRERDQLKEQCERRDGSGGEVEQALHAMVERVAALTEEVDRARKDMTEDRKARESLDRRTAQRDEVLAQEVGRQRERLNDLAVGEERALTQLQAGMRELNREVRELREDVPAAGTQLVPAAETQPVRTVRGEIATEGTGRQKALATRVAKLVPTYDAVGLCIRAALVIGPTWGFTYAIGYLARWAGEGRNDGLVLLGWILAVVGMLAAAYGAGLLATGLTPVKPSDLESGVMLSSAACSWASGFTYVFFGPVGAGIAVAGGLLSVGFLYLMNWADDHRP